MASYIKTDTHISVVFDSGESATIYAISPTHDEIVEAIKSKDWSRAYDLAFPVEQVKKEIKPLGGRVTVLGGLVHLDGTPIHNTLTTRMLQMHEEGFDINPMAKFLENLMDNPSYRAVNELYGFLENSNLPITEDGHFLAYKRVGSDFKDLYTHSMDNSPGQTVTMPRNHVNEDKHQTCSDGLHFCSRSYLPYYGGSGDSKVVMVKINPADVVSIPVDYANAKGRCCRYEVIKELNIDESDDNVGRLPDEIEGLVAAIAEQIDEAVNSVDLVASASIPSTKYIETIEQLYQGTPIAEYSTAREAQDKTSIDASSIMKVCRGQRQSAGGYQWRSKLTEVDE